MSDDTRRPVRIAPSILAADIGRLAAEVEAVSEAGADMIHVDVMDGHFVPNITIGPFIAKAVRESTRLPVDVHLMIEKPERYIDAFAENGADIIGVHVETCPNLHRSLAQIRETGKRACVTLNPATPASALEHVLESVDQVLVMTVNPGFGGQSYIEGMQSKIATIRRWIDERGLDVDLQVDGGIAPDTIAHARKAGADLFVAGTAVFKETSYRKAMDELRRRADE